MDMRGIENVHKAMRNEKHERLDKWNKKKKELDNKLAINKIDNLRQRFDIKPWTIWWFFAGENIGLENGSHVEDNNEVVYNRPCIIVSNKEQLKHSNHTKVTILPLTTNKLGSKKPFQHKLYASNYPKESNKLKGLRKDAFVICNELRTIDTKRLTQQVTTVITQKDIHKIQELMHSYITF